MDRLVREEKRPSSMDSKPTLRCRTMRTGRGKLSPIAATTRRITCRLPALPPMMSNLSGFMDLPPDFFFPDLPVAVGNGGKAKRFLGTQGQVPEILQAIVEELEDFRLQLPLEIDQGIAAKDQLKFIEGKIGHEIVGRENHLRRQRRVEFGQLIVGGIIGRKIAEPAGLDIVLRILSAGQIRL